MANLGQWSSERCYLLCGNPPWQRGCSSNWACRATGHGSCPSHISLHTLPLCHSGRQALLRITSDTSKVTLRRKVLVPGVGLEPTTCTLGTPVHCSTNWASRATGHWSCPSCILLHTLIKNKEDFCGFFRFQYILITCIHTSTDIWNKNTSTLYSVCRQSHHPKHKCCLNQTHDL